MLHIELRTVLDAPLRDAILALIDDATEIEGHRPVGEHKYLHIRVGVQNWVGVLAYDDGRLVGYAHTRWNAAGRVPRMAVEVVVHPHWYGTDVARRLLQEVRSLLARAGGGVLYLWVHRVEDAEKTLAAELGMRIQRELWFMTLDLHEPPVLPALPPGVELRPYRPDVDDAAFVEVNNAAFEGHPENGGWTIGDFRERRSRDWFDPDGLVLAWRGAELLGFHWTKWHGHDSDEVPAHEPVGEVYVLGVHPRAHGLGLGRVLLEAGLAYLHERGSTLAVLYVDCGNAAAVRLYQRRGFELRYREVCYEEDLAAASGGHTEDLGRPAY